MKKLTTALLLILSLLLLSACAGGTDNPFGEGLLQGTGGLPFLPPTGEGGSEQIPGLPSVSESWPTSQIGSSLGESIPSYEGNADSYVYTDMSVGSDKGAQIMIYGATETDAEAYKETLLGEGYVLEDGSYVKTLDGGDRMIIDVYVSGYGENTALSVGVSLEKNSGAYASFTAMDLSMLGIELPVFVGASSFDLDDLGSQTIATERAYIEQLIAAAEAYSSLLTPEDRAELEKLREMLPHLEDIECVMITAYGADEEAFYAYEDALRSAGFSSAGEKIVGEFEYEIGLSEDNGRVRITVTRMPLALIDEEDGGEYGGEYGNEDGGENGGNAEVSLFPEVSWEDLPANLAITYERRLDGSVSQSYCFTKIGEDWLITTPQNQFKTFLKRTSDGWTEYYEYGDQWIETDQIDELQDNDYLAMLRFLFSNDMYGYTESESEEIAGIPCDVYVMTEGGSHTGGIISTTVKHVTSGGFVLSNCEEMIYGGTSYTAEQAITLWDTAVTSFGDVTIPQ